MAELYGGFVKISFGAADCRGEGRRWAARTSRRAGGLSGGRGGIVAGRPPRTTEQVPASIVDLEENAHFQDRNGQFPQDQRAGFQLILTKLVVSEIKMTGFVKIN
jgi:hypothetical protein